LPEKNVSALSHEPAWPLLDQGCEGAVQVAFGARLQDVEHRQPKGMGRGLYLFNVGFEHRRIIDWVDEHGHGGRCGKQCVQYLEPFRQHLHSSRLLRR
jgi:hypothetical protein